MQQWKDQGRFIYTDVERSLRYIFKWKKQVAEQIVQCNPIFENSNETPVYAHKHRKKFQIMPFSYSPSLFLSLCLTINVLFIFVNSWCWILSYTILGLFLLWHNFKLTEKFQFQE